MSDRQDHSGTILIVDDEEVCRDMLRELFEDEGYLLIFTDRGEGALELALAHCPDLILLDVQMEGISGLEVCRQIRQHELIAETSILMVTGLRGRQHLLEMIDAGADDIVHKPYDPTELIMRVRNVMRLDRHRRILQNRAQLFWIMETSDEGYLTIDGECRIHFANPAGRQLLTLPDDWPQPPNLINVLEQCGYVQLPQKLFRPNMPKRLELRKGYLAIPETGNAKAKWLEVEIPELPKPGNDIAVRLRDVTEQVNMQRDMWSFHLIVNHKLRTPLSGLVSGLDMIANHRNNMDALQFETMADIALNGARRLKDQIEEILAYVDSPRASKATMMRLSKLTGMVTAVAEELGCTDLAITSDSNDPRMVRLSSRHMELVMRELIGNAQKFHPKHSSAIQINITPHGNNLELTIIDDGVHVPDNLLDKVWIPYYQAEKNLTGEIPGMGLGLSKVATTIYGIGGTCRMLNRTDAPGVCIELMIPLVD